MKYLQVVCYKHTRTTWNRNPSRTVSTNQFLLMTSIGSCWETNLLFPTTCYDCYGLLCYSDVVSNPPSMLDAKGVVTCWHVHVFVNLKYYTDSFAKTCLRLRCTRNAAKRTFLNSWKLQGDLWNFNRWCLNQYRVNTSTVTKKTYHAPPPKKVALIPLWNIFDIHL